jgi:hypothetical protein
MLSPVRRSILILRRLLERALDENLAILPSHHKVVDRVNTVLLDILVNAQAAKNTR